IRPRRRTFIALDQLDRVRGDILRVQLDVKIERLVDLIAEIGVDAGIRQDNAYLDGLRLHRPAKAERKRRQSDRGPLHRFLPESLVAVQPAHVPLPSLANASPALFCAKAISQSRVTKPVIAAFSPTPICSFAAK